MADELYWTYRSDTPTPLFSEIPEGCFNGDEKGWTSLSPGMRREIVRSFRKRAAMTLPDPTPRVLSLSDAGHHPGAIAAALTMKPGAVYAILREHRPDRPRAPRRSTSWRRPVVIGLDAAGTEVARIAELLDCTRAYVYRILSET